jgi:ammonium transporter, Amt family
MTQNLMGQNWAGEINLVLCLLSILVVPLAAAGLALIHQGLGRSRSAAHAMLATVCALAISAIVIVLIGSSWAGFSGGAFHAFQAGGVSWNWLGNEPAFARGLHFDGSVRPVILCLHLFAAGLAAIIPLSAGTDRWRLAPICLATALFAGFSYPLFAHWVWGGGWLSQLAANFGGAAGIAPFTDAGGAGVIQVAGGLMALSTAWILGPRRGKYSGDGMASAIPGHNIVLVLFGCILALIGWTGLESATSILFYGAQPAQIAGVILNAMLSASAGCLAAVLTTQIRYRKPDASLSANGWIAGLVAGSASCAYASPVAVIFVGAVAGALTTCLVEVFELHLRVDDPGGAISVHAGAGIWGLIAAGLFAQQASGATGLSESTGSHLLAQVVGVASLLGFMLPLIHVLNLVVNRFIPFRVDRDGDWQGMDIRELGAGAYPEFVIHADEFVPR